VLESLGFEYAIDLERSGEAVCRVIVKRQKLHDRSAIECLQTIHSEQEETK
jgi:hypothetical protein